MSSSIRQIIDQLADAKRQVERAAPIGSQAAATIAEACPKGDTARHPPRVTGEIREPGSVISPVSPSVTVRMWLTLRSG
jgi:hypothetical protein